MRRRRMGILAVLTVALAVAAFAVPAGAKSSGAKSSSKQPPIKHVFVINLENKSFDEVWGAQTKVPYLANDLKAQGLFLDQYFAVAHVSLPNYIAQISGQGPSKATQADCIGSYSEFVQTGTGSDGQVLGDGCVYPASVKTLADQLTAKKLQWKGYMEDMPAPCTHPEIGQRDPYTGPTDNGAYATRHNPFVYFHSLLDSGECAKNDVPLTQLETDLASIKTTANYNMITPNVCNDAHDETCPNGKLGGLEAANEWLKTWVPKITSSPAFKKDGLLVITFDEAEVVGDAADSSACCNEPQSPNVTNAGLTGPGGGHIGALLLSPYVKAGTTVSTPFNHYALLCSFENLFGLDKLGYAGMSGLQCFDSSVYNNPKGTTKVNATAS
ncbi:MAG: alkaline phosphatase family protein [Acidimicrobiia bacterium]